MNRCVVALVVAASACAEVAASAPVEPAATTLAVPRRRRRPRVVIGAVVPLVGTAAAVGDSTGVGIAPPSVDVPTPPPLDPMTYTASLMPPIASTAAASPAATGADAGRTEGDLDAGLVAAALRREIARIRACYEDQLRRDRNLAGRLEARFTIGIDGRAASISTSGLNVEMGACVAEIIRGVAFPLPRGGSVDFSFPFNFQPGG
jgi:hypothetical protein